VLLASIVSCDRPTRRAALLRSEERFGFSVRWEGTIAITTELSPARTLQ
jgi:hypothetical protein